MKTKSLSLILAFSPSKRNAKRKFWKGFSLSGENASISPMSMEVAEPVNKASIPEKKLTKSKAKKAPAQPKLDLPEDKSSFYGKG